VRRVAVSASMLELADTLPAKCFISHAYADDAARDAFFARLPSGLAPFVFPPITVKPDEFVSDPLINAVLDCDGLIYLRGGASDHSFWVARERDYALRASYTTCPGPVVIAMPSPALVNDDGPVEVLLPEPMPVAVRSVSEVLTVWTTVPTVWPFASMTSE
jgi:hypothetical protein